MCQRGQSARYGSSGRRRFCEKRGVRRPFATCAGYSATLHVGSTENARCSYARATVGLSLSAEHRGKLYFCQLWMSNRGMAVWPWRDAAGGVWRGAWEASAKQAWPCSVCMDCPRSDGPATRYYTPLTQGRPAPVWEMNSSCERGGKLYGRLKSRPYDRRAFSV